MGDRFSLFRTAYCAPSERFLCVAQTERWPERRPVRARETHGETANYFLIFSYAATVLTQNPPRAKSVPTKKMKKTGASERCLLEQLQLFSTAGAS